MNWNIDHTSNIPLHKQAEALLRNLLNSDEYQEGKYLPTEVDLSEQLKISRNTLRQAINTLVNEGLLLRKKGVGTRVVKTKVISRAGNWISFSEEMRLSGIDIRNFELQIFRQEVSSEAAVFFDAQKASKVMRLERLRGKQEYPFVYFISEFAPWIPLSASEDFNRPLYEILESEYGIIAATSREEISATLADAFIASKLEVKVGDAVLLRKRYVFDTKDRPVEYNVGFYRADAFTYTLESKRSF